MHDVSIEHVKLWGAAFQYFRNVSEVTPAEKAMLHLLERGRFLHMTKPLRLIKTLAHSNVPLNKIELGEKVNSCPEFVRQMMRALIQGGFKIDTEKGEGQFIFYHPVPINPDSVLARLLANPDL